MKVEELKRATKVGNLTQEIFAMLINMAPDHSDDLYDVSHDMACAMYDGKFKGIDGENHVQPTCRKPLLSALNMLECCASIGVMGGPQMAGELKDEIARIRKFIDENK
ncbi:hypothetical protein KAR91_53235 [Candidatus Pacearchaeota archaeon]|nr:hypothetical protein [Candidatus Pacearchaeota archaeon]